MSLSHSRTVPRQMRAIMGYDLSESDDHHFGYDSKFSAVARQACPRHALMHEEKTPPLSEASSVSRLSVRLLSATVVFLVIDLVRNAILLAVHLATLLRSQLAAIGSALVADFVIDPCFFPLEFRRFPSR